MGARGQEERKKRHLGEQEKWSVEFFFKDEKNNAMYREQKYI